MNKEFEMPMINVYNFKLQDISTDALSDGYQGNTGGGEFDFGTQEIYHSNYITVKGGLDENVPL